MKRKRFPGCYSSLFHSFLKCHAFFSFKTFPHFFSCAQQLNLRIGQKASRTLFQPTAAAVARLFETIWDSNKHISMLKQCVACVCVRWAISFANNSRTELLICYIFNSNSLKTRNNQPKICVQENGEQTYENCHFHVFYLLTPRREREREKTQKNTYKQWKKYY